MKKIALLFIVAFLNLLFINGQDIITSKLDSLFSLIDENNKGMGSLSLFHNDKEVYQKTIGYADIENDIKANKNTKFRIGSISKTFTAVIIMQMIDEGRLSLDTKLEKFYKKIPNAEKINIEQMLRHRSGLVNFTNLPDYKEWMEQPQSRRSLLKKIRKNGTEFDPGEKTNYSNTNYVLLSYIAESVDKKEFSEILQERILRPCNLQQTFHGRNINSSTNEAKSYYKDEEWELSTETDMSIPAGAGALISTPTDLNKFYTCLFKHQLVSDTSLKKMTQLIDGVGIGLFQFPFFEKKAFGHTGGIDGFQSVSAYFPEDEISVSYITNGVVMARNDILIGVLSIFFGRDYSFPEFKEAIVIDADELTQYTGTYKSTSIPMKISITREGDALMAQATNQPAFPLEAYDKHKFRFEPAGIKIEFKTEDDNLILYQSGMEIIFKKE